MSLLQENMLQVKMLSSFHTLTLQPANSFRVQMPNGRVLAHDSRSSLCWFFFFFVQLKTFWKAKHPFWVLHIERTTVLETCNCPKESSFLCMYRPIRRDTTIFYCVTFSKVVNNYMEPFVSSSGKVRLTIWSHGISSRPCSNERSMHVLTTMEHTLK